jgi:hypothetical protein
MRVENVVIFNSHFPALIIFRKLPANFLPEIVDYLLTKFALCPFNLNTPVLFPISTF